MGSNGKPDILIIIADQMTAALTGAYGHPVVKTPTLDRLCQEGVRFDAAYANCPICAPARASMLSGRYVSRTRSYDNAGILASDVPTFAHHLRLAGYEMVAAGKMHLIGADQLHGFERRLTTDIYPSDFSWTPSWETYVETMRQPLAGKGLQIPPAGVCDWSEQLDYDEGVHHRSLEFLRARRPDVSQGRRPFCLVVSYSHPHPPYLAPREFWDLYEDAEIALPHIPEDLAAHQSQMDRWLHYFEGVPQEVIRDEETMRRFRRAYYAMVSYVDAKVGELVDTLAKLGMRENTAIIYLSDHGDMLGERQLVEKRVFYEWSARVPLIASCPGHWASGATCDEPVGLMDLFPTLVDFCGAPEPVDIDGRGFIELLEGKPSRGPERVVLSEYHCEGVLVPCFMVRRGRYKYIYVHGHDEQLFDLEADPAEMDDLSGRSGMADLEESLRQEITARFDPDAIAEDVRRSQAERALMRQAMRTGTRTSWDYQPFFDASTSWTRS